MAGALWPMIGLLATTALVSSLMTVTLLALLARWWMRRRFPEYADGFATRVGGEVERGAEEAGAELLPRLREAAADGLRAAADEALPRIRDEVREGFREGLAEAIGPELVGRAGKELVRRGASVLGAGLGLVLGADDDKE